jgi:type IV pilus assembly protein PilA
MNRKGFTLIELLAVIVILAVIAIMVTPMIVSTINSAKQNAAKASALNYIDAVEQYAMSESAKGNTLESKTYTVSELSAVGVNGKKPTSGTVTISNNIVTDFDLTNGGYEIKRTGADGEVAVTEVGNTPTTTTYTDSVLNGADPVLDVGMIPVTIEDDGTVKKADTATAWYDYTNKKWANVVVVTSTSRSTYQNATASTPITASDILAYYVWIPRYSYKLFNVDGTTGTTASTIEITFENKTTTKSVGTTNGEKLTHPAFTFGTTELNGFWVGKFETTGTKDKPTVLPNITSLRTLNVSTFFNTIRNMDSETYGLSSDSHMAMNKEWGAVAYLTNSIYGRCTGTTCTEVSINNSTTYVTGSSAGRPGDSATNGSTVYAYNTAQGYLASTTGNIYGIYDMSGGAWEYVMGVSKDTNGNPYSGREAANNWNSGFNGNYSYTSGSLTTGINFPDSKYYQTYVNSTESSQHNGDALKETHGRYGDAPYFVSAGGPWFLRGGGFGGGAHAGVFGFNATYGYAFDDISARVVVSPGA